MPSSVPATCAAAADSRRPSGSLLNDDADRQTADDGQSALMDCAATTTTGPLIVVKHFCKVRCALYTHPRTPSKRLCVNIFNAVMKAAAEVTR